MISYLIATKHDISLSYDTIDSILSLPNHDNEIIICCPDHVMRDDTRFKWVLDDKCTGSPYAFNKAYQHSHGDYVSIIIDDVLLPSNFLDILDFMKSDFMSHKKFKVSNILWDGGPGLPTFGHDDVPDGDEKGNWPIGNWTSVAIEKGPYSVIPLPFFEKKTVENLLSGYVFHPSFRNHFIDHWLGFYLSNNEDFEPNKWRCPSIKYTMSSNRKPTVTINDIYDRNILRILTNTFIQNETSYV